MRGGLYRTGGIEFDTAITIQPYRNETPVLKGSKIADEWAPFDEFWVTDWPYLLKLDIPGWFGAKETQGVYWRGDAVFINGEMLKPVNKLEELEPGRFYCDYDKARVYIADNPEGQKMEIVAEAFGLKRTHSAEADPNGPVIRGLTLMHYGDVGLSIIGKQKHAPIPKGEMPLAPINTRIEHCRFLDATLLNLRIISPGAVIAHNEISGSAYTGMNIYTSHDAVLEHNIIADNNRWRNSGYPAGIKIFDQSVGFIVRNNWVENNAAKAIWYDVGHHDGLVYENYFRGNSTGCIVEISHTVSIFGNVFENNAKGVWIQNAGDNEIFNNTFINSNLRLHRSDRGAGNDKFGWHASTGPGPLNYHGHIVKNNVFGPMSRIAFVEKKAIDPEFQSQEISHNIFATGERPPFSTSKPIARKQWEKWDGSLADFEAKFPGKVTDSVSLDCGPEDLFKDFEIGDLRLKDFETPPASTAIPAIAAEILGVDKSTPGLGAFGE